MKQQFQEILEENRRLKAENQQLKSLLQQYNISTTGSMSNQTTAKQKESILRNRVKVFRELFRGREDVYACRWEYPNSKVGYSPVRNPRSGDFVQLTDKVVFDHLTGEKVIGIYPLLRNNTCFFLAADFDKKKWQADAKAFYEVCNAYRVPASIERSRSGNGCHIWIFFNEAIPAKLARQLGHFLLFKASETGYQAGMKSYDRLFPNQDTLPAGGFGNLIALPLQKAARMQGNSVFVDESFEAYADQWRYLSQIKKMNRTGVEKLAKWHTPRDKQPAVVYERAFEEKMPAHINVILQNGIYIEKENLPSNLIQQIIRLASFNNPAFFKAQAKRFSTYNIPRLINCTEEHGGYLVLPRGCLAPFKKLLIDNKIEFHIKDQRQAGVAISADFNGHLSAQQEDAVQQLLEHDYGILAATTGFGKTVAAASLIAKRKVNTLVLVHRTQLLDQWKERLSTFLNVRETEIGQIGGGKNKPKGTIDIAMFQSLNYKGAVKEEIKNYGQIIVDECHRVSAVSFESVLKKVEAVYVCGLTATPTRRDKLHPIMAMQCGPIRYKINAKDQAKVRPFKHVLIPRYTTFKSKTSEKEKSTQVLFEEIIRDEKRNEMIFDDVLRELDNGASPIILTERIEHVKLLESKFKSFTKNLIVLTGELKKSEQKARLKELQTIPDEQERLVIATGKYIGEGFDNACLDTMFLVMPVAWKGTLKQYVGRLHRMHEKKEIVKVYDYVDQKETMLNNMFVKRQRGYKALGYIVQEAGNGSAHGGEQMRLF
jgi:superfamily II DNA or RNA helicase